MEKKSDVLTNFIPSSKPYFDCVDKTNKLYQNVVNAGFDDYTQSNCIAYQYKNMFPNCTTINMFGYNSSVKKGNKLLFQRFRQVIIIVFGPVGEHTVLKLIFHEKNIPGHLVSFQRSLTGGRPSSFTFRNYILGGIRFSISMIKPSSSEDEPLDFGKF